MTIVKIRHNNRQLISVLVLFFFAVFYVSNLSAASGRDPYKYFFDETWGDFTEELKKAKAEGKQGVLLFFEQDECPFCHRMKETVLNQSNVQEYFKKHFLIFSVDIEGDVEIVNFKGESKTQKDFAFKQNRVRATPVFAFYDLTGKKVVRYTGATSSVEEFMLLGEYFVSRSYEKMRFTKYKRLKKTAAESS